MQIIKHVGTDTEKAVAIHPNSTLLGSYCGCLLDNYLYMDTGHTVYAFYETYVNHWESDYTLMISESGDDIVELITEFTTREIKHRLGELGFTF